MTMERSEAQPGIKTFSRDQIIIPETQIPQEVLNILHRAEKAGIKSLEPYHLSGITLTKDSDVEGWIEKPGDFYWNQILKGNISQDAATLPDSWVLVDGTQKPYRKNGKQMYKNDPFRSLLKKLRKDKKIGIMRGIPNASRFGISRDNLNQVVLPEIAKLLEIPESWARLLKLIEFNIIGNLKHPEWGETDTYEWFNDTLKNDKPKFYDNSLIGGSSIFANSIAGSEYLGSVGFYMSSSPDKDLGFRPLIVVPTKA